MMKKISLSASAVLLVAFAALIVNASGNDSDKSVVENYVDTSKVQPSALRLGDLAPNFKAITTAGEIDLYEYLGNGWGILFSHPADFTPVCTTELGKTASLKSEFDKRNVKVLALSVDPLEKHMGWIKDINETQNTKVEFPLIADPDRKVANLYGMIHPNASETATVRSLFVISPDKKIKLMIIYPAATGRNFNEVLRVVDALQLTSKHSVSTPADWKQGDDVIIGGSIKTEDAMKRFPKGVRIVKPYLRYTPQPD
jgi:thioredoxin-dependent peroxiredoxin